MAAGYSARLSDPSEVMLATPDEGASMGGANVSNGSGADLQRHAHLRPLLG